MEEFFKALEAFWAKFWVFACAYCPFLKEVTAPKDEDTDI